MTAPGRRRGLPFHARLTTPGADERGAFRVVGRLTPYEVETLVLNAQTFPRGSRLELVIRGRAADDVLADVRAQFAGLAAYGIEVVVHRADRRGGRRRMAPPPADAAAATGGRERRVLVAEDDADMRSLVATLLRTAGHEVVEAADGLDVLEWLEPTLSADRAAPIDVVVSDVEMPGLSGLDVLAALRASNRSTPVVLITAYGNDDVRAEARELGAAAVLDKPLDPHVLRDAVAHAAAAAS
jgi:CheY-like chemotaxis protein